MRDVVDGDLHAVLAPPLLGERVQPLVVGRHEMRPRQDPDLFRLSPRRTDPDVREPGDDGGTGRGAEELTPRDLAHPVLLLGC